MKKGGKLLQLITSITVNQILTENSKKALFQSFTERKQQLQREIEQLKFELKRLEKSKKYSITDLYQYFEKEIEKRHEKIEILDFQLEQLELLPLGSQLKEREIQGLVNVEIGDDWNEKLLNRTIIVKDGIIEDIK